MYIVDRIVDNKVVLETENENSVIVDICSFDFDVKQGDVLAFTDNRYVLDTDKTQQRKNKLLKLQRSIFNKMD